MVRLRVAVLWLSALALSLFVVAVATMAGLFGTGQYDENYCFGEADAPVEATSASGPRFDWPNHLTCDYHDAGTRTFTDETIPVGLVGISGLGLIALAMIWWSTYRLTRHLPGDSSSRDTHEEPGDPASRNEGVRL